jgi:hypothetical protein
VVSPHSNNDIILHKSYAFPPLVVEHFSWNLRRSSERYRSRLQRGNLKVSASLHSSNQQIHRLKHAVWSHGRKGGHPLLQSISYSQQTYVPTMLALPRLLGCVFAFKRFKTSYVERKRKRKISIAQSSGSSEHMMASSAKHSRPEIVDLTAVADYSRHRHHVSHITSSPNMPTFYMDTVM